MKTKQQFSKTISAAMLAAALFFGSSAAFAQVKIGTNPTVIGATNNLEVEASTAGNKVSVDKTTGKVTIADGSQGAGKVLTSDANGVATWTLPSSIILEGTFTPPSTIAVATGTGTVVLNNCPITLNKGTYTLYYYAQFDFAAADVSNAALWPIFFYFDFITTSGAATFPSYRWQATNLNDGPHVIPIISWAQSAGKVSQLVVVSADNTVIIPRFRGLSRAGNIQNSGPIIAVKM